MKFVFDVTTAIVDFQMTHGTLPVAIGVPKKLAASYPPSVLIAGVYIPVRKIPTKHTYKANTFWLLRA